MDREKAGRVLGAVLKMALIVFFLGSAVLFLALWSSLSGWPVYVTKTILPAGGAAVAALCLLAGGFLGRRGKRLVLGALLAVCLAAGVYVGHGVWRDNLPSMSDRDLMLWQYQPFEEGTKAVRLEEESTLRFERYQRLELDGATALYPVYAAFVQAVYPEGEYKRYSGAGGDSGGLVACNGTEEAYERLISREVDMIFCAAPSQEQRDAAEAAGMELYLTPIGREAFVFFVNSRNPVTGLTVEQVQKIYTGELTNWSQVGGKNQAIRPFQRSRNSGSQSALLRLMEGLPLMEPEEEDVSGDMGGIIRQVASYRNYSNAIGFSFRFYAAEMVRNGDIRLLALDGVEPTKETIRDGSYPISSSFYAVTAGPKGGPDPRSYPNHAAFLDWILSEQGQELVERTGYVSVS